MGKGPARDNDDYARKKVPGPGEYKQDINIKKSEASIKFSKDTKLKYKYPEVPGPGSYASYSYLGINNGKPNK